MFGYKEEDMKEVYSEKEFNMQGVKSALFSLAVLTAALSIMAVVIALTTYN